MGTALVIAAVVVAIPAAAREVVAHPAGKACASPDVTTPRDPANPLALPVAPAPGQSPLTGAHFFVDGPRHGQAAGAIAQMLGMNPMTSFTDSDSWAQFQQAHGSQFNAEAQALSKIAGQEETQNVSLFAGGGGPGAILGQTTKLLCRNAAADPTPATVMVFSTFFIYPRGRFCPSLAAIQSWQGTFGRDINEMARGIGSKRAVILMEIDSIGTSSCLKKKSLTLWLHDLSWEANVFSQLPHAVVYEEAGYSDAQGPLWTAKRLWQAGVNRVEGFWTNGTHFAWSSNEIKWAEKVSNALFRLSHGSYRAHFVVNTAQNGQGPKLNPHPVQQGIENLCNPPGRGLGRTPTGNVDPTSDRPHLPEPGRVHVDRRPGTQPQQQLPRGAVEAGRRVRSALRPGIGAER